MAEKAIVFDCKCGIKVRVDVDLIAGQSYGTFYAHHCGKDVGRQVPGPIIGTWEERDGAWITVPRRGDTVLPCWKVDYSEGDVVWCVGQPIPILRGDLVPTDQPGVWKHINLKSTNELRPAEKAGK